MDVKLEKHYGVEVFVSAQAEAVRKSGCLCVHTENGKTTMCAHLKKNIELQNELKIEIEKRGDWKKFTEEEKKKEIERRLKTCLMREAIAALSLMRYGENPITENGNCMIAEALYGICLVGNIATAITRCPYYKPEKPE